MSGRTVTPATPNAKGKAVQHVLDALGELMCFTLHPHWTVNVPSRANSTGEEFCFQHTSRNKLANCTWRPNPRLQTETMKAGRSLTAGRVYSAGLCTATL